MQRAATGTCEIWGSRPSLWFPVAEQLGFTISAGLFRTSSSFVQAMQSLYPSVRFNTRRNTRPSIVFADDSSLRLDLLQYWDKASCPHVFYGVRPPPPPPRNWIVRTHCFDHLTVGGATACKYYVSMYLRPNMASTEVELSAIAQRPWTTILASLDRQLHSSPAQTPPFDSSAPLDTPWVLADGSYASWGLYPLDHRMCVVTMPSHRSPTGWGSRRLVPTELADLWNAPISMIESLHESGHDAVLRQLVYSAPAKILSTGADYFITCFLRGGYIFRRWTGEYV